MEAKDISYIVEVEHPITYNPHVIKVTAKNGILGGFFQKFDDAEELKKENKWRFIPSHKSIEFQNEVEAKGILNKNHSVILKGEDILKIELI